MTFKEIVKEWWDNVRHFSTTAWKAIRNLFSTSFSLIKEPVMIFLKALWEWIKAIASGMYEILKSFFVDLVSATGKMIWRSLVCFVKWIISKIKDKEEKSKKKK